MWKGHERECVAICIATSQWAFKSLVSLNSRAGSRQSCQGGGIKGTRDQVKLVKAQKRTEAHGERVISEPEARRAACT